MLTEIPFEHFTAQAAAFPAGPAQLALAAAAAGNSRARLWLNAGREPAGALWDQANNVVYLAGPAPAETWAALQPDIRAQALALGRPRFSLRLAEPAAGDPGWPAEAGLVPRTKLFYAWPAGAQAPAPPPAGDTRFEPLTGAFLAGEPLRNLERVRAEVEWMWPALGRFAAHGFGVAAVRGGAVLCWCTAEYVGPAACGIGIETDEAAQRQGLATAAAARFVAHSLSRGRRPHWECDSGNAASARVAEKVGFELAQRAPAWVGRFQ